MHSVQDTIDDKNSSCFSGRVKIIDKMKEIIDDENPYNKSIVNIYGVGGIGKTTILHRITDNYRDDGCSTAIIDLKNGNADILDIIYGLYDELEKNCVLTSECFETLKGILKEVEEASESFVKKYNSSIQKEGVNTFVKDYLPSITDIVGGAVGESVGVSISAATSGIGGMLGGGIGSIVGFSIGSLISKIIELHKHDGITALNRIGLTKNEIDTFVNFKYNVKETFIDGLNKLSEKSTVILGFDTFERVPFNIKNWLSVDFIPKLNFQVKIIISGRDKLLNGSTWFDLTSKIASIEIEQFSEKEAKEFLKRKGISDTDSIEWIINISGCLPWAIALCVDFFDEQIDTSEKIDYKLIDRETIGYKVVERFLNHIDNAKLKEVIQFCSIINCFDFEIIQGYFKEVPPEEMKQLFQAVCKYSFVRHLGSGKYAIHDVVSGFLNQDTKCYYIDKYYSYNSYLSTYYQELSRKDVEIGIRAKSYWYYLYHLLNLNEENGIRQLELCMHDLSELPIDLFEDYFYNGISNFTFYTENGKFFKKYAEAYLMTIKGEWDLAEKALNNLAYTKNPSVSDTIRECAKTSLSEIYLGQGFYEKAKKLLEEILKNNDSGYETRKIRKTGSKLCEIYAILGKYKKGEQLAIEIKNKCDENKEMVGLGWACKSLGDIYRLWGKSQKAIEELNIGLEAFVFEKDDYGEAVIRTQLARNYIHIGRWEDAESELDKSEEIYKKYNYKYGIANCKLFRGNIFRLKRDWTNAKKWYDMALTEHREMKSDREIGPLLGSLGLVYYNTNDAKNAKNCFDESIQMKNSQGYARGVMITEMYKGDCLFGNGDWEAAYKQYENAQNLIKKSYPIYVNSELAVKLWICDLLRDGLTDELQTEYENLKRTLTKYEYHNLIAQLEYYYCVSNKHDRVEKTIDLMKRCLVAARTYNIEEYQYYFDRILNDIHDKYFADEIDMIKKILNSIII